MQKFHKRIISLDTAKEALKDILVAQSRQISIDNIQKTVADYYRLKMAELLSKKRTRNLTRQDKWPWSLARELTTMSLPEIGNSFGGKDHSTVIHACKTMAALRISDTTIDADLQNPITNVKGIKLCLFCASNVNNYTIMEEWKVIHIYTLFL